MNSDENKRARSDIYRVADWADRVEFGKGRHRARYDRDEAIKQLRQNDGIERLTSVFMVVEGMQTEEIAGKERPTRIIGQPVVFIDADEAHRWASECVDGDNWEVVAVSIKGQT